MLISTFKKVFASLALSGMVALTGCSGGGAGGTDTSTPAVTNTATQIVLATSSASVKSDGSNSSTITATVLNASNAVVPNATVTFSTQNGQLGAVSGASDANGQVTIPFSAGTDRTNRTAVITATVTGSSASGQTAIQVTGSTLSVTASSLTIQVGGAPANATLSAVAKDAASTGVASQSIRISIPAGNGALTGGTGSATSQTVTTAADGTAPAVTFTPASAGTVSVTTEWLNASGAVTLSDTKTITVTAVGIAFAVTSPATSPSALQLGASQAMTVSVPTTISGTNVANVRFASTLGTWQGSTTKVSTQAPAANAVTETLVAGASSGTANIQIDALDGANNVLATLNWVFALSAPAATAANISLQPSVSNVAPNTGGVKTNTSTLTATVRDASLNTVSGASVLFEIMNPTGSGEEITPVLANTNSSGQAVATFYSGVNPTVGGLKLKASIVGQPTACDNSVTPAIPGICDVKTVNVTGSGVSVSLGSANVINSSTDNTNYLLPMSVLVVSSSGTAVANATVSLAAFPTRYYSGGRAIDCSAVYAVQTVGGVTYNAGVGVPNEDANENDILDGGEDKNGDLLLSPAHSTAGTVPATVTTDASGSASFTLTYQKQYSSWIETRIRAKTVVSGTESTNELKFVLPYSQKDANPCSLPPSPGGW